MTSCPDCGAATEAGDRFCGACGEALGSLGAPAPGAGSAAWSGDAAGGPSSGGGPTDEVELLVVGPSRSASGAPGAPAPSTTTGRRSPRMWLAAVAAVLVLAVGAWAVGRVGGRPVPTADEAAADTVPSTTDPTDTVPSTTDPTTDPTIAGDTDATYDADTVGPVLGRPVGWSLLIGTPGGDELERVDLDTGKRVAYAGVGGGPLLIHDGWLLLRRVDQTASGSQLGIVPAADPGRGGVTIELGGSMVGAPWLAVPGPDGGLWVLEQPETGPVWRLIRPADGHVVDEVAAAPLVPWSLVQGGGPDLTSSGSGGVYRRDGDGYRQLSAGTPIAVHDGAVLTRTCSAPATCQLQWLDVDTGQALPRAVPAGEGVRWLGLAGDSGRFAVGWRPGAPDAVDQPEFVVFDLDRARLLTLPFTSPGGSPATSPDGRYLAIPSSLGVQIYDAERDRWVTLRPSGGDDTSVLFVANGQP